MRVFVMYRPNQTTSMNMNGDMSILCICFKRPIYSRLSLSRIPKDSLKYFEIAVPRHIRFAELEKKQPHLTNLYVTGLEAGDIAKILWKRGEAPLFHNIFHLLLDFHV